MIEWQSESSLFTLRVRAKQWYWIYKLDLRNISDVHSAPRNIGRNRWQSAAFGDLQTAEDYLHIIQIRAHRVWAKTFWEELDKKINKTSAPNKVYTPVEVFKTEFLSNATSIKQLEELKTYNPYPSKKTLQYYNNYAKYNPIISTIQSKQTIITSYPNKNIFIKPNRKNWYKLSTPKNPFLYDDTISERIDESKVAKIHKYIVKFKQLKTGSKIFRYQKNVLFNDVVGQKKQQYLFYPNKYSYNTFKHKPLRTKTIINTISVKIKPVEKYIGNPAFRRTPPMSKQNLMVLVWSKACKSLIPIQKRVFRKKPLSWQVFLSEIQDCGVRLKRGSCHPCQTAEILASTKFTYIAKLNELLLASYKARIAEREAELKAKKAAQSAQPVEAIKPIFTKSKTESFTKQVLREYLNKKHSLKQILQYKTSEKLLSSFKKRCESVTEWHTRTKNKNYTVKPSVKSYKDSSPTNLGLVTNNSFDKILLLINHNKEGFEPEVLISKKNLDLTKNLLLSKKLSNSTNLKKTTLNLIEHTNSTEFLDRYKTEEDTKKPWMFKTARNYKILPTLNTNNSYFRKLSKTFFKDLVLENYLGNKSKDYSKVDLEEETRILRTNFGKPTPLRVLKCPSTEVFLKESFKNTSTPIELIRFRFNAPTTSFAPKPTRPTVYLTFKQKRYNQRLNIIEKDQEYKNFKTQELSNYSGNPFLKNNVIIEENFGKPTRQYRMLKKAKSRLDKTKLSNWNRLLRSRRVLVLPAHVNITVITNSFDVVHSWHIPGLGLKMDCLPGRATHHTLHIDNVGLYYGQCAEICGRYHHHMPIRICALPFEHFLVWWHTFGLPKLLFFKPNDPKEKLGFSSVKHLSRKFSW